MKNRFPAGRVVIASLLVGGGPVFAAVQAPPPGQSVSFAWDASSSAGVVNYNIYYGKSGGPMNEAAVGNVTTGTVSGLAAGATYTFYVTANNAAGVESAASDLISYTVPVASPVVLQMQAVSQSGGGVALTITAAGSVPAQWALQCSTNLQSWVTCASGSNVPVNFQVTDVTAPQNFYRLIGL